MKVLVLGGGGFVGREVVRQLRDSGWAEPVAASRASGVDTLDATSLARALQGMDAVVNCVAGDGRAIAEGANALCQAVAQAGQPRLVHMSTQSVYGSSTGRVDEATPMRGDIGWYGQAKISAEERVQRHVREGGQALILRPGCVAGPGSSLWLTRIAHWLRAGWIGDLGAQGDGWSNLVHVRDLARCTLAALQRELPVGEVQAFNVVAPDSPRWNRYFIDLAMQIHATPVRRISARRLRLTSSALGIPLKLLERAGMGRNRLPPGIPPSLLRLWTQEIQLDPGRASACLIEHWTPYADLLAESAASLLAPQGERA